MRYETIGENIRKYRKQKGVSQEELAEAVEVSPNYIGMIERAEKIPSLDTFIKIANSLDTSADLLLADVLSCSYEIKSSLLEERLKELAIGEREKVYKILDVLIDCSNKAKR